MRLKLRTLYGTMHLYLMKVLLDWSMPSKIVGEKLKQLFIFQPKGH